MKYFYAVIILLSFSSLSVYAQKNLQIKPVQEQTKKSYPIDGSLLLQKQYKEVADYITAHPSMYSNMKMQKTAAWGFTGRKISLPRQIIRLHQHAAAWVLTVMSLSKILHGQMVKLIRQLWIQ